MKQCLKRLEKRCKNLQVHDFKKYTCFSRRRKIPIESVWGRFLTGNSDKESSHPVAKILPDIGEPQ